MGDQAALRLQLCALIKDYGSTTAFISRETKIDQSELNKFKLGKLYLTPPQVERLDRFLRVRGYDDELKAFGSIIQGRYNNS